MAYNYLLKRTICTQYVVHKQHQLQPRSKNVLNDNHGGILKQHFYFVQRHAWMNGPWLNEKPAEAVDQIRRGMCNKGESFKGPSGVLQ